MSSNHGYCETSSEMCYEMISEKGTFDFNSSKLIKYSPAGSFLRQQHGVWTDDHFCSHQILYCAQYYQVCATETVQKYCTKHCTKYCIQVLYQVLQQVLCDNPRFESGSDAHLEAPPPPRIDQSPPHGWHGLRVIINSVGNTPPPWELFYYPPKNWAQKWKEYNVKISEKFSLQKGRNIEQRPRAFLLIINLVGKAPPPWEHLAQRAIKLKSHCFQNSW